MLESLDGCAGGQIARDLEKRTKMKGKRHRQGEQSARATGRKELGLLGTK